MFVESILGKSNIWIDTKILILKEHMRVSQNTAHGQNLIGGKNTEKTTGANLFKKILAKEIPLLKN